MDVKDIEHYLSLLGRELDSLGVRESIDLLLIGGGYMPSQVQNRSITGDVDAMWVRPEIFSGSDLYLLFKEAVWLVADIEGLEDSWLNTDVSDFMRIAGPLPKMKLWKRFGPVHVYLPPKDFILAHKLLASRPKDRDDIEALFAQLGVNSRKKAQKILDKYIDQAIQENHRVNEKLDMLFE